MIRIVSHDPTWTSMFESEANRIANAIGHVVVRIHHIGSTAIPKLKAKPIIDILLEVVSVEALDKQASMLGALGYEVMGEFGIPGRRYFRLDDPQGVRTHQVHAFQAGVAEVVRHIAFRDYMRAHPLVADEYGALKEHLANTFAHDRSAYVDGKDAFVKEHERRALRWVGLDT